MENNYKVYKHTTPSGKIYIGITKQNVKDRWLNGKGYINNKHFYRAILKYGWNNIKHEILFNNLSLDEANNKEKELIKNFNLTNRIYGYNIQSGGNSFTFSKSSLVCKIKDETGNKYNKLTALNFIERKNNRTYWEFKCDCGNVIIANIYNVKSNNIKSCGCLAKTISQKLIKEIRERRFPNSNNIFRKELYKIRSQLIYRSKKADIKVCDEWKNKKSGLDNFYNWAINNGYKKGLYIVRKNIEIGFNPDNCYFGNRKDLSNSRKTNRKFTINGEIKNMFQWAEQYNINPQTLNTRIKKGETIKQALRIKE